MFAELDIQRPVGGEQTDLSESDRHHLLASERRRILLDILVECRRPAPLDEIASQVATQEGPANTTDENTVERVQISLHHQHLPQLAGQGLIDYDPETNQIATNREQLEALAGSSHA